MTRNEKRLEDVRRKVSIGLDKIREGGGYRDAARLAGYSSDATFSRACVVAFGARPRDIVRGERERMSA